MCPPNEWALRTAKAARAQADTPRSLPRAPRRRLPGGGGVSADHPTEGADMSRDPERYREQCERVATDARDAGLNVAGLIAGDLGWHPGVVLAHPYTEEVWRWARAHGYVATPSGRRRTVIEATR